MTTQLRLVEPPAAPARSAATRSSRPANRAKTARVTRTTRSGARSGRRTANWGDWHLDAGTRQVGRAGVAEARRALEAAIEQQLSQAS